MITAGWAVTGWGRVERVLRTTATVLLDRMTSNGRQMYIAAFINVKPVMTVIMAPVMTRGRSRSGRAMSPSTKPICCTSRCQNWCYRRPVSSTIIRCESPNMP